MRGYVLVCVLTTDNCCSQDGIRGRETGCNCQGREEIESRDERIYEAG